MLINWDEKKHVTFKTNHGYNNYFEVENTDRCNYMIRNYFSTIEKEFLLESKKIELLFDGKQIKYEDNTTVGQYFQNESVITIIVNDPNNLYFIDWNQTKNVVFQVNTGYKIELTYKLRESLDELLKHFLNKIDHTELIYNNKNIQYLYNSQLIKFGDKTTIGELF